MRFCINDDANLAKLRVPRGWWGEQKREREFFMSKIKLTLLAAGLPPAISFNFNQMEVIQ